MYFSRVYSKFYLDQLKAQESESEVQFEPNTKVNGSWLESWSKKQETNKTENLPSKELARSPARLQTSAPKRSPYKSPERSRYHHLMGQKYQKSFESQGIEKYSTQTKNESTPVIVDHSPPPPSNFVQKESDYSHHEIK